MKIIYSYGTAYIAQRLRIDSWACEGLRYLQTDVEEMNTVKHLATGEVLHDGENA